jgi:hypothetical protein
MEALLRHRFQPNCDRRPAGFAAALAGGSDARFAATVVGMVAIGIGAALANPQISSVILP